MSESGFEEDQVEETAPVDDGASAEEVAPDEQPDEGPEDEVGVFVAQI